jgi:hypothetical protein
MTTNTELINPETEDNDLYITDKIEQIRLGKQLKRKESGIEVKHVVYAGKKFVLTGKETKDAFDETTVKKRDRNYVLFESKLGTEKRVDIIGLEKKLPKKEQKPYQKPQLKQTRTTNLGVEPKVVNTNIEIQVSKKNYLNQPPQLRQNYSYRLGIGETGESSYLEKSGSKPNQYNNAYPQLKSSISYYKLGIEQKVESTNLEQSGSKPNQYNNAYPQLKSSTSYKLGIEQKVESPNFEQLGSRPNQYHNPSHQKNSSFSFRLGTGQKVEITNLGRINSNQYQKLNQKPERRQRAIRTPGPRQIERVYSHSKKKDYLDNYQYLETHTLRNPRKKSFVKHIRFGEIIGNPNESNNDLTRNSLYEPKINQPQYTEITYNPKMISQKTEMTITRKNNPQLISYQTDNSNIKRVSRTGARTPAVKTIDFNSFMNKNNYITTTNWKPSIDVRNKKPEIFERQIMPRKDISQPYETRTEIRKKITTNSGLRNQPNNQVERIRVNRHRNLGSSTTFISNEPRIDNLSTLNVGNSITTTSRISRRNINTPLLPIDRPSITPSIELYNSSSSKPETKVISKVEVLKSEIRNIPNVERRQISEVSLDTNFKKRNSIRAQYKNRK